MDAVVLLRCLLALPLLVVVGCTTVPLTGRQQLRLVPDSQMTAMSYQQYAEVIKEAKLSDNQQARTMLNHVGRNIAAAAEQMLAEQNVQMTFDWEFNLIEDDKQVNAWAMPGGKVAFYTGILPYTKNETGMAVVMGHEVSHALARHGSERFSIGLVNQLGMTALDQALATQPEQTRQVFMTAAALGAQFGAILPYSRKHESEADEIGLILMARAGYDPREAVAFWQRMSRNGGQKPPEWMSTHPADATRIAQLKQNLPKAMAYYRPR